jgi:ribosome modulation factor
MIFRLGKRMNGAAGREARVTPHDRKPMSLRSLWLSGGDEGSIDRVRFREAFSVLGDAAARSKACPYVDLPGRAVKRNPSAGFVRSAPGRPSPAEDSGRVTAIIEASAQF